MRKILKSAIVLVVVLSLTLSCGLACLADDYGTKENGMSSVGKGQNSIHGVPAVDSFKNADFSEGLRYWSVEPSGKQASDFVDLKTENGKNYVSIKAGVYGNYDGIMSVRFLEKRLKPGDRPIMVYEWRSPNPEQFAVYIGQAYLDENGKSESTPGVGQDRISEGASQAVPIISSADPNGWNVSMSHSVKEIQTPKKSNQDIYLFVGVQAFKSKTVKADIANLKLATYNKQEGKIYDLDGNVMYDLKELNSKEAENFYKYDDPFSFSAKEKQFGEDGKSVTVKAAPDKGEFPWLIVGIAGVIAVVAAVVVVIILMKRKNTATIAQDETEAIEEEDIKDE